MKKYSVEFKKVAVQKFLSRGSRNIGEVSQELGVSIHSIYRWVQECGIMSGMSNEGQSPQNRSSLEKFKAVMEHDRLDGPEQGLFLRREGLHTEHVDQWRRQMQEGLGPKKSEPASRIVSELTRENRDLKNELNRKNAALAETTALLVLKKKADLIWGSDADE
jgi:transposase-like protein